MNWKWKGQTIYPYDAFYRRASERFGKGSIGGADARRRLLGLLQSNDTPRSFGNDPDWNKF